MNKTIMFLGMLAVGFANAQQEGRVGINADAPKATLDVKSIDTDKAKGALLPQLTGDELKAMTANLTEDQHGLITFAKDGVSALDNIPTNNVQFAGYHRFNMVGDEKSWVRLEPSGLEKIKGEGTNIGWRLIGNNHSDYGVIGEYAVDFSIRDDEKGITTNMGAIGRKSFAINSRTTAKAHSAFAAGYGTIAEGGSSATFGFSTRAKGGNSMAIGQQTVAEGGNSFATGFRTTAVAANSISMGIYNTRDTKGMRLLSIGDGSVTRNPANTQGGGYDHKYSDALIVLNNGKTGIDIDEFENTTSDAKFQVNGAIKVDSKAETLTCNEHNAGTMSYKEVKGSGVFGFCTKKASGEYVWAYLKGAQLFGESANEGTFGSGL